MYLFTWPLRLLARAPLVWSWCFCAFLHPQQSPARGAWLRAGPGSAGKWLQDTDVPQWGVSLCLCHLAELLVFLQHPCRIEANSKSVTTHPKTIQLMGSCSSKPSCCLRAASPLLIWMPKYFPEECHDRWQLLLLRDLRNGVVDISLGICVYEHLGDSKSLS